jgi:hypothetical protein
VKEALALARSEARWFVCTTTSAVMCCALFGREILGCCSKTVEEAFMSDDHRALVSQFKETLTQQRYNPMVVHNYCV